MDELLTLLQRKSEQPVSIILVVDEIIMSAMQHRSSDIHIDPTQEYTKIRFRIDGILQSIAEFPITMHGEIIARLKILAGLRTDEHQSAQDGRFRWSNQGLSVDVRVSVLPTYYGENAVLRLLMQKQEDHTFETLGFSAVNKEKIIAAMQSPYGMILTTGPTGSGKTTTLYHILKMLNLPDVSIVTIEDPIEYAIDGIKQIQINARTGLTFATGLRSILRQDPNIIMVGEIRDGETASIATNVALTGHLLVSSLHTNDPATTLPRLLDMGIESYLVSSTVTLIIGQQLVRKICVGCKESKIFTEFEMNALRELFAKKILTQRNFFYGPGCSACNYTGFKGRIALHEVLVVDEYIREAILRKATARELKTIALSHGMVSMIDDGLGKAIAGITTVEEVGKIAFND